MTIKEKILKALDSKSFPDLKFIFSDEVLDNSIEVLDELLDEEKEKFKELLAVKDEELSFNSFEDDSSLDYFWGLLNHLESVESSDKVRNIIEEFRPKLQDFWNEISYSKPYFQKYLYVNENCELDEEEKRIMYLRIKWYKDRWIDLELEKQERIKVINKRLWDISDKFTNNIVDEEKTFEYLIKDFEIIKNLPKEVLDIAKKAWEKKWWYLFDADPTSNQALMKYCTSREVRSDIEKSSYSTSSSWEFDNRWIVLEILKLKKEKAKILWYNTFAEMSLNSKMADSPEQIFNLVEWVSSKARLKARDDLQELKDYFKIDKLETFDISYYSRILKEEKYDLDEKEIKKYFEYENVLNYLHRLIENFYSIEIREVKLDSYNENIRVYEIYKEWELISYYFLDAFYRKNKRPWAWANNLREKLFLPINKVPVVLNVCNFQKAESWKTTLYMRDVETLFHEFWHAIHEMLSESKHSELSWFWVEWDFVELPSQLLENWVSDKNSLRKLAKHVESWETISEEIIEKLEKLNHFMSWVFVARQNEFALLDMSIYSSDIPENIEELDKKTLEIVNKYSIYKRWDDYKMYCSFNHIFGWGYSAWYYSYMWAEIIEADIFSKIKELWMFDSAVWEKLFKTIIGQWTRKKASDLFFDFMWREVDNKAYMERYGI